MTIIGNNNIPKSEILSAISNSKKVLIVSHARPDGDCLGAAFAMREYCLHLGKLADVVNDSPLPESYAFIEDAKEYNVRRSSHYDLSIVVDCATNTRYQSADSFVRDSKAVVWIDHHMGDNGYGTINWISPEACSTCEMIYRLLCDEFINVKMANYLFMGLSTDTGHFMHNNVTVDTFAIAVGLMTRGARCSELCTNLYKHRSLNKTRLIAKSIESMRFFENGKICIIPLTSDVLSSCGVTGVDTEGMIDYATAVEGVRVGVCISEEKQELFKVSLRSRSENVVEVAEFFGGGGHKFASGCQLYGYAEDVMQQLVKAIKDILWTD